jgi:hypothetical protein
MSVRRRGNHSRLVGSASAGDTTEIRIQDANKRAAVIRFQKYRSVFKVSIHRFPSLDMGTVAVRT